MLWRGSGEYFFQLITATLRTQFSVLNLLIFGRSRRSR